MSAFYVGQRVRIVRAPTFPELLGVETTISGKQEAVSNPITGDWVGYPVVARPRCGATIVAPADCLEPILPEGAAPSEFTTLADLLTSLNVEVPA